MARKYFYWLVSWRSTHLICGFSDLIQVIPVIVWQFKMYWFSFTFNLLLCMLGRKRKKSKTSNYIISCDPTDLSRQADGFVGKLRSNIFGTTFFVYDNGSKIMQNELRQDMAVVIYVSWFSIAINSLWNNRNIATKGIILLFIFHLCRTQIFLDSKGREIWPFYCQAWPKMINVLKLVRVIHYSRVY